MVKKNSRTSENLMLFFCNTITKNDSVIVYLKCIRKRNVPIIQATALIELANQPGPSNSQDININHPPPYEDHPPAYEELKNPTRYQDTQS